MKRRRSRNLTLDIYLSIPNELLHGLRGYPLHCPVGLQPFKHPLAGLGDTRNRHAPRLFAEFPQRQSALHTPDMQRKATSVIEMNSSQRSPRTDSIARTHSANGMQPAPGARIRLPSRA